MRVRKFMVACGVVVTGFVVMAGPASAQYDEPDGPVSISGATKPGSDVEIEACCFAPYSMVDVIVASTPTLVARLQADADGRVKGSITLPADLDVGGHTISARGVDTSGEVVVYATPVTVGSAGSSGSGASSLPATGAAIAGLVVAGSALLATGLVLNRGARRRAGTGA